MSVSRAWGHLQMAQELQSQTQRYDLGCGVSNNPQRGAHRSFCLRGDAGCTQPGQSPLSGMHCLVLPVDTRPRGCCRIVTHDEHRAGHDVPTPSPGDPTALQCPDGHLHPDGGAESTLGARLGSSSILPHPPASSHIPPDFPFPRWERKSPPCTSPCASSMLN